MKYQFRDKTVIKELGLEQDPATKEKIPQIMNKICTTEELEGLSVWALKGLNRLLRNKEFTDAESTEDVRTYWLLQSNPVLGFIQECIILDLEAVTPKDDVYRAYTQYCRENGKIPERKNELTTSLNAEISIVSVRTGTKNRVQCYKGIKLNEKGLELAKIGEPRQARQPRQGVIK
jgi:putative DNA primase/helicase